MSDGKSLDHISPALPTLTKDTIGKEGFRGTTGNTPLHQTTAANKERVRKALEGGKISEAKAATVLSM